MTEIKIPGPDVDYDDLAAAGGALVGGNTGERLKEAGAGWANRDVDAARERTAYQIGEPTDSKEWLDSLKRKREPKPCRLDRGDGQICGRLTLGVITPEVRIVGPGRLAAVDIPICEDCQEKVAAYRAQLRNELIPMGSDAGCTKGEVVGPQ